MLAIVFSASPTPTATDTPTAPPTAAATAAAPADDVIVEASVALRETLAAEIPVAPSPSIAASTRVKIRLVMLAPAPPRLTPAAPPTEAAAEPAKAEASIVAALTAVCVRAPAAVMLESLTYDRTSAASLGISFKPPAGRKTWLARADGVPRVIGTRDAFFSAVVTTPSPLPSSAALESLIALPVPSMT